MKTITTDEHIFRKLVDVWYDENRAPLNLMSREDFRYIIPKWILSNSDAKYVRYEPHKYVISFDSEEQATLFLLKWA